MRPLTIPILQMEQAQKPHSHQEAGEIRKKKKESGDINKQGLWQAPDKMTTPTELVLGQKSFSGRVIPLKL